MRTVPVAVDGSDGSRLALRWATRLAENTGRVLRPLTAWQYPASTGLVGAAMHLPSRDKMDELAAQQLREVVREEVGIELDPSEYRVLRGPAAGALLGYVGGGGADLIVLGNRGLGGFDALFIGSTALHLLEHSPCAVIVVPDTEASLAFDGMTRIVVGVDDESSREAARWCAHLAGEANAEVIVVRAVDPALWPTDISAEAYELAREMALAELDKTWCAPIRRTGVTCRLEVREGDPRDVLYDIAGQLEADLVVVGARRGHSLTRAAMGRVSTSLVRHLDRPIAVVPAAG